MCKYFLIIIYTLIISSISLADTFILGSALEKDSPDYIRTQKTVSEIFRRAGNHKVKLINLPAERSLIKANSGQIDGDVARVKGAEKEFENLTIVEEPLTTIEVSAYTLNPEIKTITLSELKNYSVIYVIGSKAIENNILEYIGKSKINPVSNTDLAFQMLNFKRANLLISVTSVASPFLSIPENSNIIKISPPLFSTTIHLIMNKKHKAIIPVLNKAIVDMKKDGILIKLMK